MAKQEPAGLYLIVETSGNGLERLQAVMSAVRCASVLVRPVAGGTLDATAVRPFVELIQVRDAAALLEDDVRLARTLRADGVHLTHSDTLEARFGEAREILGQRAIVGADAGALRHDAMMLGEAGAEYVAFTGGVDAADVVQWWAEIFEIPCVAIGADQPTDFTELARAGADFVAIDLPSQGSPEAAVAHVQQCIQALTAQLVAE